MIINSVTYISHNDGDADDHVMYISSQIQYQGFSFADDDHVIYLKFNTRDSDLLMMIM
jgi:hypothetical protein